jgi:hypothetical protein
VAAWAAWTSDPAPYAKPERRPSDRLFSFQGTETRRGSARLERKFARWTIGPEIAAVGGETYSYLRADLTAGFSRSAESFDLDGWDGNGTGLYAGVSWSAGF